MKNILLIILFVLMCPLIYGASGICANECNFYKWNFKAPLNFNQLYTLPFYSENPYHLIIDDINKMMCFARQILEIGTCFIIYPVIGIERTNFIVHLNYLKNKKNSYKRGELTAPENTGKPLGSICKDETNVVLLGSALFGEEVCNALERTVHNVESYNVNFNANDNDLSLTSGSKGLCLRRSP